MRLHSNEQLAAPVHSITMILAVVATSVTFAFYEMRPRLTAGEPQSPDLLEVSNAVAVATPSTSGTGSTRGIGGAAAVERTELPAEVRQAMESQTKLLEKSIQHLRSHHDYVANFVRQERVGNELRKAETIDLKVRCQPFSVYMRWPETKREVLFIDGKHDGDLLIREGGWKGTLGLLKLAPKGALAMSECRYPLTEAGLERLVNRLLDYRYREKDLTSGVTCRMDRDTFEGRDCDRFTVEYHDRKTEPVYKKSITWLDREQHVPVCVRNYGWLKDDTSPADHESRLIEVYTYRNVRFNVGLTDADFDVENKAYAFRK